MSTNNPFHLPMTRRHALRLAAAAGVMSSSRLRSLAQAAVGSIQSGPFAPTRASLQTYQAPEWYANAKFGIWAHWGPQSQVEQGDWYARYMYVQGTKQYDHHLKTYGHPSKSGYKDICPTWKAQDFDPDHLIALYKKAGALLREHGRAS